jgi:superfamily I DNA and/or RNA helicase
MVGSPASFQGDERDIIFLSLVTAHNHSRKALTTDKDKRRFNVAASRAKDQLWLFHSVQLEALTNHNGDFTNNGFRFRLVLNITGFPFYIPSITKCIF